ncbi:MAG: hypothetical protein BWK77_02260 [Verrucomicrobia bacterium A1]|nr:MAG: hypothetical protein BWK77_02260 [Verrucomicrobia bacterium A1]
MKTIRIIAVLLLLTWPGAPSARAGDVEVNLDTSEGSSSMLVKKANADPGFRMASDGTMAAGNVAQFGGLHPGCFMWLDSKVVGFASSADDQFLIGAAGGLGLNTQPWGLVHFFAGNSGDAKMILEADRANDNENDNPTFEMRQDGGATTAQLELNSNNDLVLRAACTISNDMIFELGYDIASATDRMRLTKNGCLDIGMIGGVPGSHKLYVASASGGANGAAIYAISVETNTGIAASLETDSHDCALLLTQRSSEGSLIHGDSYGGGGWHRTFKVTAEGKVTCSSLTTTGVITCASVTMTGGGDVAEPFDIADGGRVEPGMVLSIDANAPGKLRVANTAYDTCVAGIVSGAGGVNPGVLLSQENTLASGQIPVALSGRVYVQADASHGAIRPGDLLTTSGTPGHAMKADPQRAAGATIGKAMTPLEDGRGLVLVLVSLQ